MRENLIDKLEENMSELHQARKLTSLLYFYQQVGLCIKVLHGSQSLLDMLSTRYKI